MAEHVSLVQVLLARDRRSEKQRSLLARYQKPLICFTMNIPGPVKRDLLIEEGFFLGISRLEAQLKGSSLPILFRDVIRADTGCEGYYVVDGDSAAVKALCLEIEEADALGRLFDLDVLNAAGRKLERGIPRTCLICGGPAQVCGRSRAHSLDALLEKVRDILTEAVNLERRRRIAAAAVKALLFEVAVTPKPGLVDRLDPGSHKDMDIFTFLSSASALGPYFETCAAIGQETPALSPKAVFDRLRYPGKLAEQEMYRRTGGVNTHKGAIFSLGILCAAAGRLPEGTPEALLSLCADMTAGLAEAELGTRANTSGERIFRAHGLTGVRGQAQAGFPAVREHGLPILRRGLSRGLSLNDAACAALLHMMAHIADTNLIARSDLATQQAAAQQVWAMLEDDPFPDHGALQALNRDFVKKNLSPGGSADLLSLTLFLHFLQENAPFEGKPS